MSFKTFLNKRLTEDDSFTKRFYILNYDTKDLGAVYDNLDEIMVKYDELKAQKANIKLFYTTPNEFERELAKVGNKVAQDMFPDGEEV